MPLNGKKVPEMRNTDQRREQIVQMLLEQGKVEVSALVEKFDVSAVTIRTDLITLEERGLAERNHGGATLTRIPVQEQSIRQKIDVNILLKKQIGARAAQLVGPRDNIIIDSGTTTLMLAQNLRQAKDVTVMTNGLNIAWELADTEGIDLMLTGGWLRKNALSFHGTQAENCLNAYGFDKLFLGVDGCDAQFGLTTHHEAEASLNSKMVDRAKRVIVLADSSKFGHVCLHRIAPLDRVHAVVTDPGISAEYREEFSRRGIELIIAE
jgi:DeoR family transcriptional regulator, aga operon transcriptional repressor